jgi:hemolysin activation/secretion protein
MILVGPVLQSELDHANANQDRQIYAELAPGSAEGTTELDINVKDRLPLHGKLDFNNQSSPGTPELRLNGSIAYNNLWQLEHSVGFQYGFSPEAFKEGSSWAFYDGPLVVNYGGFYRLPLGNPGSVEGAITSQPANFGYDEATRRFRLPPGSGSPELNFYASRSTIDTGVETTPTETLLETPTRIITRNNIQEDLTLNEALGFRLSDPLFNFRGIRGTISGGFDFKHYSVESFKTFLYTFTEIIHHTPGDAGYPVTATLLAPTDPVTTMVRYLPLTLHLDASRPDKLGSFDFSLGYSANFFNNAFGTSPSDFQKAAGSQQADGLYMVINPSLSRDLVIYRQAPPSPGVLPREWRLALRIDGQWANQPLISNEQFGVGGINGVRGYREGEIFGDTGWRITSEFKTPPHLVGIAYGKTPLVVRGSVFMDYAQTFLLDPGSRKEETDLWGVGFGGTASIGPHWGVRLLISWPLLSTIYTEAYQPRFDFGLTAQF